MSPGNPQSPFTWPSLISIAMPLRGPNDDDDDDEDEDDEADEEPAVIREPDEDE